MSDLDEYQMFTDVPKTHYLPDITLRKLADAAIAELEAALEHALSWEGLLEFIDYTYPPHIFTGESGDPGPRFIVLLRELKQAEAELDDLRSRRCETCKRLNRPEWHCPLLPFDPPADFGCSRWTASAEEGE